MLDAPYVVPANLHNRQLLLLSFAADFDYYDSICYPSLFTTSGSKVCK